MRNDTEWMGRKEQEDHKRGWNQKIRIGRKTITRNGI